MGVFSWKFANTNNERRLRLGRTAYLYCPNGAILHEPVYEGYGKFLGHDVYELVADWNRVYLSEHPEFVIPHPSSPGKPVSEYPWYEAYADLSKTHEDIEKACSIEYRFIGIDIACYDIQNECLPYPIKICSNRRSGAYKDLPYSQRDPDQGM